MNLLEKFKIGNIELVNRVIMAPLTRQRAKNNLVSDIHVKYYTQRAGAGLIISEATQISPQGIGYPDTPGIHREDQIEAWKKVTDSVHEAGGKIYCQLWHVGRSSHPDFHKGELPVAPSAVPYKGKVKTPSGIVKMKETPRALELDEIPGIIEDYTQAAENSIKAGFDGVEIHGANGYLIDQFICDGSNKRTDKYGGSVENRSRFGLEVVEAVIDRIGNKRTAIRLSPSGTFNEMYDSDAINTFAYFIDQLNKFDLSYLHITEHYNPPGKSYPVPDHYLGHGEVTPYYRKIYKGVLMTCQGFERESGEAILQDENADLVAFGKLFISNPDLPKRFELNAPLNNWDVSTFYGGDERGYTDYPSLKD